jgi:precorrin-3B methylase
MTSGSLTVVGTGIPFAGQMTLEARAYIEKTEKVLFAAADPATYSWIIDQNETAESIHSFYNVREDCLVTYFEMVEHILTCVLEGLDVCVVDNYYRTWGTIT